MPCRSTPGCRPGRRRTAAAAAERADVLSPRIEAGFMQNLVAIRWRVWWWSLNMCFAAGQLAIFRREDCLYTLVSNRLCRTRGLKLQRMSGVSCGQSLQEQGFEAATTSRRQKCPSVAPGGPAGESRAPASSGPGDACGRATRGGKGTSASLAAPPASGAPQLGGHGSPMVPAAGPGGPVPLRARTAELRTAPPACPRLSPKSRDCLPFLVGTP